MSAAELKHFTESEMGQILTEYSRPMCSVPLNRSDSMGKVPNQRNTRTSHCSPEFDSGIRTGGLYLNKTKNQDENIEWNSANSTTRTEIGAQITVYLILERLKAAP